MGDIIRETRNRSRSKTPFLRSQCDSESCAHAGEEGHSHQHHHEKKKKTPNVQTITEEVVEVTSKSPPSAEKSKQSSSKTVSSTTVSTSSSSTTASKSIDIPKSAITSDYSSEDASPETIARIARFTSANKSSEGAAQVSSYSSSSITTRTVITSSGSGQQQSQGNKNVRNLKSTLLTSTPKGLLQKQNFSFETQQELSQNDQQHSNHETSTQLGIAANNNNSSSSRKSFKEQTNGNLSDHVAYKEYKEAGEYWNKYPKTDYTYSESSPYRREICPGVIGMPNMSRCSLGNHHERVNEMIQRSPAQEEYIRRRYAYQTTANTSYNRQAAEKLIYDSQDEVDLAQFESYRKNKRYLSSTARSSIRNESWYKSVFTSIVTTVYSFWSIITGGASSESELYRTRIAHEERGFFGRISHGVSSVFIGLFRYIYMAISTVLSLDTWLLKSSNAENKNKKRFLLLLLILLPLLLLAGIYYYLNPHEPFPPRSLSEITFTLPNIDLNEFYNQEKYEAMKASAYNSLDDLRDYTHEYFAYLKQVSMNILDEGKKIFQENVYYERI